MNNLTGVLWTIAFLAGIGFFAYQIWGRLAVLMGMRTDDGRDYSRKTWGKRTKNTIVYAFGQYKFFLGDQPSGWMHIIIFWGFMTLSLQVITMFMRGWFWDFHFPGLGIEPIGAIYAALKDFFQAGVIIAAMIALTRWLVIKPTRLFGFLPAEAKIREHSHLEAVVILLFISTIMLTGFIYDAGSLIVFPDERLIYESRFQPITSTLANYLSDYPAFTSTLMDIAWWTHNLVVLTFLNLLPRSKHFHIITAIPNVFLGKIEPAGWLMKKDYGVEEPLFGRSQPNHFTFKQVLDAYSCTECGRCSSFCPATATGKPLAPRQFLLNLRDDVYKNQPALIAAGAKKTGPKSADGVSTAAAPTFDVIVGEGKAISDDVIWSCVTCRACEEMCPVNIEYVDKIVDIRQHLVQEASRFPEELNRTFKGLENNSNPWGIASEERAAWAEGFDVPTIDEKPDAEYLYFVGCGGSFDAKHKKATQSFVKILKEAGVSFAILGKKEMCNGETARRLGNEYLYQTMAEGLTTLINGYNVKKVLVNCPHCFNTMKHEYPQFGGNWEVEAAAVFTRNLLESGKVKLKNETLKDKNVVYHDSCYFGRHNGIYEDPRKVLSAIPNTKLTEMTMNRREGTCCGAGGARMWVEEKADQRVNVMRTEQALEKKPDVIATSCPFCRIMLGSGVNEKGLGDSVEVMDVMELVANNMDSKASALPTA